MHIFKMVSNVRVYSIKSMRSRCEKLNTLRANPTFLVSERKYYPSILELLSVMRVLPKPISRYLCMVTHVARVRINRVKLPILLVVS